MMNCEGILGQVNPLCLVVLGTEIVPRIEREACNGLLLAVQHQALLKTGLGYVDDISGEVVRTITLYKCAIIVVAHEPFEEWRLLFASHQA